MGIKSLKSSGTGKKIKRISPLTPWSGIRDGNPYILEANLFCSFGAHSVLVAHAAQIGYDDKELLDHG